MIKNFTNYPVYFLSCFCSWVGCEAPCKGWKPKILSSFWNPNF